MSAKVTFKKVGEVAVLTPLGRLQGVASGPLKVSISDLQEEGVRRFLVSFSETISIDRAYAQALNSIYRDIRRNDGRLILSDAGPDVIPWLDKYAPDIPILKTLEMALEKMGESYEMMKGIIAVAGTTDISRELFKGIANYRGLVFHYFDNPIKSSEEIIKLKPVGILLNLELGTILLEPLRRFRYSRDTKSAEIILFGSKIFSTSATALIREGASDYLEVKYEGAEVLAYLKALEFRNRLARRLDLMIGEMNKSTPI